MKFQRVLSEDCRTPVRGQTVKQSAEIRSALHSPNDVVRMSPCEVSESVIRRLQNTISWTGNETECRVSVCVGVLRNSTQERSLPVADRARFTVVKLRLPALGAVLTSFGTENFGFRLEARFHDCPRVAGRLSSHGLNKFSP